ncbi:MAG TPA: carboxypeptidase regulatory-like domain-containing protein [Thermoanaerobaculia bacterium]|nr:carboxypeptidase regulatory-like domain-containing protein [Thermoanaerobaculia bacterium]
MKRLAFLLVLVSLVWHSLALAAPSPGIAVTGLVLDSNGKPVQGARVRLVPWPRKFERWTMQLAGRWEPEPAARGASDAQGRFRLTAPEAGMWRVIVEAPGKVPQQHGLAPLLEAEELPPVLLPDDVRLETQVVDPAGKPVEGARVVVASSERLRNPSRAFTAETWEPLLWTAVTGANGKAVPPLAEGERWLMAVLAAGSPPARAEGAGRQSNLRLDLERGCERIIEVTDGQRRPVPGAVARIGSQAWLVSDAAGRIVVPARCKDTTTLNIETSEVRDLVTVYLTPLPPGKAPEDVPVRVALPAPFPLLTGRVVDAVSREPVAGAFVWTAGEPADFARTDARGSYAVPLSDPSSRTLVQAVSLEHMPAFETVQATTGGQPAGPAFALIPVARVEGIVVDAEGQPVDGAQLQVLPSPVGRQTMMLTDSSQVALSDSRGLFRLRLASRVPYEITAVHEGYAPVSIKVPSLEPRSARKDLRIVLERGRTAFGRVVDTREQPVAGARVSLRRAAGAEDGFEIMIGSADAGPGHEGTTDATGRFEIGRLPAGRFDLMAQAEGFAPMVVPGVAVEGKAAARVDLGTVVLPPGMKVEGTVVDPQGQPLEGVRVAVQPTDFLSMRTFSLREEPSKTGPDGRFAISGLREGQRIDIKAWREGYLQGAAVALDIPAPGPVRIVLEPGARVAGRVVTEDGKPIANVGVYASGEEGGLGMGRLRRGAARTDETGRFELDGLEPGKLVLRAVAAGYLGAEARVEAVAGAETPDVRIVLRMGAVVTGRVLGPDGAPVPGADVRVIQTSREETVYALAAGGARTDGEGNYRLAGIEEGRRSIAASHDDFQRAVKDLDVRAGENRLDLQLGRGHPVTGRVVDAAGRPVADARVVLSTRGFGHGGEGPQEAASSADGSFRFPSVASGTYVLSASREGYAPGALPDPVQVGGAPVADLEVRLETGGTIRGRIKGLGFEALAGLNVFAVRSDGVGMEAGVRQGGVDFEGAYTIEGVTPGDWMVMAMSGSGSARGRVTLPEGASEVSLDLEFGAGFTLSGRVLRAGQPMPGLQVVASGNDVASHAMGSTGAQGEFRLEGLEAGTYNLAAMDFRKGLRHVEEVEISADREIVIELPTQRVSGRVVDATDSSPVEGASIVLESSDPRESRGRPGEMGASTDPSGAFSIGNVAEGTWRVIARKEGYSPSETTVEVGSGADVDGVRLTLSPGAGLVLEVRTTTGSIPAQIFAALLDAGGRSLLAGSYETGEGGRVRLTSAPAGRFRLYVSAAGAATTSVDVAVPGEPVRVVLPPASQIVVDVPDLAGQGGRATLSVTGADGQPFRSVLYGMSLTEWPLLQGRTVVEGVPPGTWRLRVTAADGRTWEATATTTGGRTQVVLN